MLQRTDDEPWGDLRQCFVVIGANIFVDVRKFDTWLRANAGKLSSRRGKGGRKRADGGTQ